MEQRLALVLGVVVRAVAALDHAEALVEQLKRRTIGIGGTAFEPAQSPGAATGEHGARSSAWNSSCSTPWRCQTSSMLAVLPPPTWITSAPSTMSVRSSSSRWNSLRWRGRHRPEWNAS